MPARSLPRRRWFLETDLPGGTVTSISDIIASVKGRQAAGGGRNCAGKLFGGKGAGCEGASRCGDGSVSAAGPGKHQQAVQLLTGGWGTKLCEIG